MTVFILLPNPPLPHCNGSATTLVLRILLSSTSNTKLNRTTPSPFNPLPPLPLKLIIANGKLHRPTGIERRRQTRVREWPTTRSDDHRCYERKKYMASHYFFCAPSNVVNRNGVHCRPASQAQHIQMVGGRLPAAALEKEQHCYMCGAAITHPVNTYRCIALQ